MKKSKKNHESLQQPPWKLNSGEPCEQQTYWFRSVFQSEPQDWRKYTHIHQTYRNILHGSGRDWVNKKTGTLVGYRYYRTMTSH